MAVIAVQLLGVRESMSERLKRGAVMPVQHNGNGKRVYVRVAECRQHRHGLDPHASIMFARPPHSSNTHILC